MSYSICSHIHICTICMCVSLCVPNSIASTGNSFCIFDIECIIDNPSSWPPLLKGTPVEPARSSLCLSFATSFLASFICAHATAYFNSPLVLSLPTVQTKHSQQQQLLTCACVCACACASCYGKLVLNALLPPVPPPPPPSLSLEALALVVACLMNDSNACFVRKKYRIKEKPDEEKLPLRVVALFVSTHLHFVEIISVTFIC